MGPKAGQPVALVEYDPAWPGRYSMLEDKIRGALGDTALQIEHVGSTSVPGLVAKPIDRGRRRYPENRLSSDRKMLTIETKIPVASQIASSSVPRRRSLVDRKALLRPLALAGAQERMDPVSIVTLELGTIRPMRCTMESSGGRP